MYKKVRLDIYLLLRGFVESRQKAKRIILAGKVRDKYGKIFDKPGQQVPMESEIQVVSGPKFVSRGGNKLLEAFEKFPIDVKDRICLDAGISTGGFTDCLLQKGAKIIYGIDVGYGQAAWKIRNNPRVKLFERTNIRYLQPSDIFRQGNELPSFVVADLSFISLKLVLEPIRNLVANDYFEGIFLIKPQFELGKEKISKGGVVKETIHHIEAIESIINFSISRNFEINGLIASPLIGPAGNHEYLIWVSNQKIVDFPIEREKIEDLVKQTIS
ncbi:MAG: TlyA family rRNA (cytidine-2'-O)-methyltransferase [Prochlorococcus sp. SP3034]|nr:TlyA family rRNA (cytidine-2'-O)-methyltransferase [Prochlorococcus sp. SP3034]|tara:strand:+ start:14376 stop:15191 length:816 start_codon:yes stop_codon:yes gene_type:complete